MKSLVTIAAITLMAMSTAQAAVTCKIIPSWCPRDSGSSSAGNTVVKTSVPEPGSLLLLGTGLLYVAGVVVLRRRVASKATKQ